MPRSLATKRVWIMREREKLAAKSSHPSKETDWRRAASKVAFPIPHPKNCVAVRVVRSKRASISSVEKREQARIRPPEKATPLMLLSLIRTRDQSLDVAQAFGVDAFEVGEIETQSIRRNHGACLMHMIAEYVLECCLQEMCRGMMIQY